MSSFIPVLNPLLYAVYSKLGVADHWLVIRTPRNHYRVAAPSYNHIPSSRFNLAEQLMTYSWVGVTLKNPNRIS